jgi:mono/diheme cytochrome c family protein
MRTWVLVVTATISVFAVKVVDAQTGGASVWDGIYTAVQAERGANAYGDHCAECHGTSLDGTGEAPPLAGPEFLSHYDGRTVGNLFDRTRNTMPNNAPGTLSRNDYADILAYILKFNGFPAGDKELDRRSEYLQAFAFHATK